MRSRLQRVGDKAGVAGWGGMAGHHRKEAKNRFQRNEAEVRDGRLASYGQVVSL